MEKVERDRKGTCGDQGRKTCPTCERKYTQIRLVKQRKPLRFGFPGQVPQLKFKFRAFQRVLSLWIRYLTDCKSLPILDDAMSQSTAALRGRDSRHMIANSQL